MDMCVLKRERWEIYCFAAWLVICIQFVMKMLSVVVIVTDFPSETENVLTGLWFFCIVG